MDHDGTLRRGRLRSNRHCARWGHSSPPQKGALPPSQIFGPSLLCTNIPLGTKVGLSPGHFVLDGHPAPYPKRGGSPPIFVPSLLWPNGCMDQDATWYGGRPRLTRHCVRCRPSCPQKKGASTLTQVLAHVYSGQMYGWIRRRLVRK